MVAKRHPRSSCVTLAVILLGLVLLLLPGDGVSATKFPFKKLKNYLSQAIISTNPTGVRFYLYDFPDNKQDFIRLDFDVESNSAKVFKTFEPAKPVKVIIHGFLGHYQTKSVQRIKDAYLQEYGKNATVLIVDWSRLGNPKIPGIDVLLYRFVVQNTAIVGHRVAEFLAHLTQHTLTTAHDIHIIGFSLGAHVAANAGMHFHLITGKKVARITGLDPAKLHPLRREDSRKLAKQKKLNQTDAEFVDVIHTGAARLGLKQPLGHADFYVNGGLRQPLCEGDEDADVDADALTVMELIAESVTGTCSHFKAVSYFIDSITNGTAAIACNCYSWEDYKTHCGALCKESAIFGERCPKEARGRYYLEL